MSTSRTCSISTITPTPSAHRGCAGHGGGARTGSLATNQLRLKSMRACCDDRARSTCWLARGANTPPMEDEGVRKRIPDASRKKSHQVALDGFRSRLTRPAQALRHALDVSVDHHPFRGAEGHSEY